MESKAGFFCGSPDQTHLIATSCFQPNIGAVFLEENKNGTASHWAMAGPKSGKFFGRTMRNLTIFNPADVANIKYSK